MNRVLPPSGKLSALLPVPPLAIRTLGRSGYSLKDYFDE
jgi:hypothetical protein